MGATPTLGPICNRPGISTLIPVEGAYCHLLRSWIYADGAVYGGHNTYNTSRQGLLGAANGSTSGGEFSTWGETGYDFHFGDFKVGPLAAFQYTYVSISGFNEHGSLLPLQIHSDRKTPLEPILA